MFSSIIKKFIGSKNERELKKLWPIIARINAMEPSVAALSDEQLRGIDTFERAVADDGFHQHQR